MNDRLRDRIHDPDPALARAAELAAAVPAVATSEARKERVRKAVLATPSRRVPWLLLRPSVALAVVLLAGAVMAATVGRAAIGRAIHRLVGPEPSSEQPAPVPGSARLGAPVPSAPLTAKSETPAPSVAPPAAVTTKLAGPRAPRTQPHATLEVHPAPASEVRPAPEPPAPAPVAKAPTAQESALLMSAVRALRHEHDPARAAGLLDDYLRRYPSGVLAEEALALSIEAASARGDGRAAALARAYLQRYPHGRFAAAARAAAE